MSPSPCSSPNAELRSATARGDLVAARRALRRGASVTTPYEGALPLEASLTVGCFPDRRGALIRLLLAAGAEPLPPGAVCSRRARRLREALTHLLFRSIVQGRVEDVQTALDAGARPVDTAPESMYCDLPMARVVRHAAGGELEYATATQMIRRLVAAGASVDDRSMVLAAERGHHRLLRRLMAAGGSPNAQGGLGRPALAFAVTAAGQGYSPLAVVVLVRGGAATNIGDDEWARSPSAVRAVCRAAADGHLSSDTLGMFLASPLASVREYALTAVQSPPSPPSALRPVVTPVLPLPTAPRQRR